MSQTTMYFITGDLHDRHILLAGIPAGSEVHLLDPAGNGLAEIAAILSGRSEIDAIHLFSHGQPALLQLGTLRLSMENIMAESALLRRIGTSLRADGDILLYGCNVATGDRGLEFVDTIARLTNANVAASSTLTGAAAKGGDWNLAVHAGMVTTSALAITGYDAVLVAPTLLSATVATTPTAVPLGATPTVVLVNYNAALALPATNGIVPASLFSVNINNVAYTPTNVRLVNTLVTAALGSIGTVELFLPTNATIAAGSTAKVTYTPVYPAGVTDLTTGIVQSTAVVPNDAAALAANAVTLVSSTGPVITGAALTLGATAAATSSLVLTYSAALAASNAGILNLTQFGVTVDGVTFNPSASTAIAANATTVTLTLPATVTAALLAYGTHSTTLSYIPAIPVGTTLVAPLVDTAQGTATTNKIIQSGTAPAAGATNDAPIQLDVPVSVTMGAVVQSANVAPVFAGITAGTAYTERTPIAVNNLMTVTESYWNGGSLSMAIKQGEAGDTIYLPTAAPTTTSGVWVNAANQLFYTSIGVNGYVTTSLIGTINHSSSSVASGLTSSPVIIASFNGSTSATVSNAAVQSLMQSLMFNNVSHTPTANARTISFDAVDGTTTGGLGLTATQALQTILVTPVNEAPIVTAGMASRTVIEAGGVANNLPNIPSATVQLAITDIDSPLASLGYDQVAMTAAGWTTADGGLTYTTTGLYGTATLVSSTNQVTYLINNTLTATEALAAGQNVTETFAVHATDGLLTATTNAVFNVTGANDAPTISATPQPGVLVEAGGVANAVAGTAQATVQLTLADVDTGAVVSYNPAALALAGWTTADNGVTYTQTGLYGTATLTVAASTVTYALDNAKALTQSLLGGQIVQDKAFTVQVTDGTLNTSKDVLFQITGANDAPTLNAFTIPVVPGVEDREVAISFSNLQSVGQATDPDNSTTLSYVVQAVSSGTLKIGLVNGVATAYDPLTNNIIDASHIAYWTPALNANGTLNAFTVNVQDNSGLASANIEQVQVNVTAVNDAPTLTTFNTPVSSGNEDTEITITVDNLLVNSDAADVDGTVAGFVVKSVVSGTLRIGADAVSATAFNPVTNNTVNATHIAFWQPALNANGTLNALTVVAQDNGTPALASTTPVIVPVSVFAVNDAPTIASQSTSLATVNEDTAVEITLADFQAKANATDVEGPIPTYVITSVNANGTLSIKDTIANVTTPWAATTNDLIDATHNAIWQGNLNANGLLDAFTVIARDAGGLETGMIQEKISVTPQNDPPEFDLDTTVAGTGYTNTYYPRVGAAARVVADTVFINDVDVVKGSANDKVTKATVTLASGAVDGVLEVFEIKSTNLVTVGTQVRYKLANYDANNAATYLIVTGNKTSSLVVSGTGTSTQYQDLLKTVYYSDTNMNAAAGDRTVNIELDMLNGSAVTAENVMTKISAQSLVHVPWIPVIDLDGAATALVSDRNYTLTYTENGSSYIAARGSSVTDLQGNIQTLTVTLRAGNVLSGEVASPIGAEDQLVIDPVRVNQIQTTYGITTAISPDAHTVTFTGNTTSAGFQYALQQVQYTNTSDFPTPDLIRYVDVSAVDADAHTGFGAKTTINIVSVNDAPLLTPGVVTGTLTEGGALTAAGSLAFADPDLTDLPVAHLATTVNYVATTTNGTTVTPFTLTAAQKALIQSGFTLPAVSGNTNNGTVNWNYQLANAADLDFLGANDRIDATFTVTVDDGHGAAVSQNITMVFKGQNDIPVITPVDVAGQVWGGVNAKLSDSGSLTFSDLDLTDRPSLSVATKSLTANNTIVLTSQQIAALSSQFQTYLISDLGHSGTVKWTYQTDATSISFLNRGDKVNAVFTITVNDGHGGTAFQDVAVEISQNAIPQLTATDVAGAIQEGSASLTDSGSFGFTLNNAADNPTVQIAGATFKHADGTAYALNALQNAFGYTLNHTAGVADGTVDWNFATQENVLDFLSAGETLTGTYTVTLDDNWGSTATQNITVVMTGANDAPTLVPALGKVSATITEGSNVLTDSGSISFADVDLLDMVTASASANITAVKSNNTALVLSAAQIAAIQNAFSFTATAGNNGTINWTYAITENDLNFLASNDRVSAVFTVTVNDGHGGTASQDITVTLNGTADAPIIAGMATPVTFKIDGGNVALFNDPAFALTLLDNADMLTRATVTITGGDLNNRIGDVQESIVSSGIPAGLTVSGTGTTTDPLVISGSGTAAAYKAALQTLSYNNTSQTPIEGVRTFAFSVTGSGTSPLTSTAASSIDVKWTPMVDLNGNNAGGDHAVTFNEHLSTELAIASLNSAIMDPKALGLNKIVVQLNNPLDGTSGANETLAIATADIDALALQGVTTTFDAAHHTITFEALAGAASTVFDTAINAVNYSNTTANPSRDTVREVTVQAFDVNNVEGIGANVAITYNKPASLSPVTSVIHGTTTTAGGTLTVNDPDGTLQNGFIAATTIGTYGNLVLGTDGSWSYALHSGVTGDVQESFTVRSTDATPTTVTVQHVAATGTDTSTTDHISTSAATAVIVEQDGTGGSYLDVKAPATLTFSDAKITNTSLNVKDQLLQATQLKTTTDTAFYATASQKIDKYVQNVTAASQLSTVSVRTLTFDSNTTAPGALYIDGITNYATHQEALVIDASQLASGTVINLNNVAFALVMGAAHLQGGDGENYVVGDASAQYIVLGAGDDTLYGGAGDDTIGSLGGNDFIYGETGNDTLLDEPLAGGNGNDYFDGGDGIDTIHFNGQLSDYTITATMSGSTQIYSVVDHRTVSALTTTDGSNTVLHVENFIFSDNASDNIAPTLVTATGSDIGYDDNIVISFSENVLLGSGQTSQLVNGAITVHEGSTTGAVVAAEVSTSTTGFGTTVTINPTASLLPSTHYYVTFDNGSVHDLAGNNVAATTYDFMTLTTSSVNTAYAAPATGNGAETAVIGIAAIGLLAWFFA